jgi:RNA polymerase sigma-70 factor (ECF subfamily)
MTFYAGSFAVSCNRGNETGVKPLQREQELNRFFSEVEKRALRIAEIAIRDRDEALDIVQDAMFKLARNYADKDSAEWASLFYRILQNGVRDYHRRRNVRNKIMVWFGGSSTEENDYDPIAAAPDPRGRSPEEQLQTGEAMQQLETGGCCVAGQAKGGLHAAHV